MNKHQQKLKELRQKNRIDHKLTYKGAEVALGVLMIIPLYILHDMFGFGNKRCEKFIKEFHRLYNCVKDDKVSLKTLAESLDAETGLVYDINTFEVFNRRA